MVKKKSRWAEVADYLAGTPLTGIDFGFDTNVSRSNASNSLTQSDLQRSIELLKEKPAMDPWEYQRQRDIMKLRQLYSQQLSPPVQISSYYNQASLGNRGGKMPPRLFNDGQKVTVRSGKTIWTVVRSEVRNGQYGYTHLYYLEDEGGRQTREEEQDLRAHKGAAAKTAKTQVDFNTVVISKEKREQIEQALEQINSFDLIFNVWGFGDTIEKGRGVSMLFYGPPGTGKTLMAQAIANKLGKTLNIISTADIESSAPGEAERNIRKHFKEAKEKDSILLFDECDSLIYTRANVGPILSAQINELLSQIERFDGITLFTTNRLGTLDEAVNRRLALKLAFEMPTVEERVEIWKRMFPEKAPVSDDVEWDKLASIELSGGYIKNAVLRAARMAAIEPIPNDRKEIKMKHLKKALRLEAQSMLEFQEATAEQQGKIGRAGTGGRVDLRREVRRG